eukprot:TRINITY_DN380_c0_g1_i1.p1 TRINITY_DN380_c0_g1~~TRINITY_DN380_c0_g1_i1.p1  ORF type:complete len:278 (+),score=46.51 TRINITY_DN380_c0_g1_i1:169-1002(+)
MPPFKRSQKTEEDDSTIEIDTYPSIGGGVPVCEGRSDFHASVRRYCEIPIDDPLGPSSVIANKLIVVGQYNVGKTSLIKRFCENNFTEGYKATIGVDFMYKKFHILGHSFALHLWDSAGQEQFKCISRAYFRGAKAVLLAFDLGDEQSLYTTKEWLEDVNRENGDGSNLLKFVVGLKGDLFHAVDNEKGQNFSAELGAEYWEVSAKNNVNVTALFQRIAVALFENSVLKLSVPFGKENSEREKRETGEERGITISNMDLSAPSISKEKKSSQSSCCK